MSVQLLTQAKPWLEQLQHLPEKSPPAHEAAAWAGQAGCWAGSSEWLPLPSSQMHKEERA